jgi:hypothetical protein
MPTSGWTASQIIAQVNGRTENRAMNKPNFNIQMEFWMALDEFCGERHYWWRRRSFSMATIVGQQSYDLNVNEVETDTPLAPDLEEIEEVFVVNSAPQPWPFGVAPDLSARQIVTAMYGDAIVNNLPATGGYFIEPGPTRKFWLGTIPQTVFTIAAIYWAIPQNTNLAQDIIPLVPPYLHWGLLYALERRVYEYLYTQNDPRWIQSDQRYQKFLEAAAKSKQFSSQQSITMRTDRPSVRASGR